MTTAAAPTSPQLRGGGITTVPSQHRAQDRHPVAVTPPSSQQRGPTHPDVMKGSHTVNTPNEVQARFRAVLNAAQSVLADEPSPATARAAARRMSNAILQLGDRTADELSNHVIDTDR